jgi:hypothetical protein
MAYVITRDYEDAEGRLLRLFVRFGRANKVQHVSARSNATLFPTRTEAERACPAGYQVSPPKQKRKAKK